VAGVCRRWRFRRGQVHRSIPHHDAHVQVPSKRVTTVAKVAGDGNGGPRPWHAGSDELDGGSALMAGPVSTSGSRRTQWTKNEG
jgi:hypothetical protein